eukprot:3355000-Prymnesium_polylepis.1
MVTCTCPARARSSHAIISVLEQMALTQVADAGTPLAPGSGVTSDDARDQRLDQLDRADREPCNRYMYGRRVDLL